MVRRLGGSRVVALDGRARATALGLVGAPLLATLLAGCGMGAMGQSVMSRDCGPNDTRCVLSGLDAPLAVGARLKPAVTLHSKGSGSPLLRLLSTRPDVVEADGGVLTGKGKGVAAVLVANDDGVVLDFLHVSVSAPTRLELHGLGADGSSLGVLSATVELLVGEGLYLQPHAYVEAQELLGDADGTWTVDPPIADVLRTGKPDLRRLLAKEPGQAAVKVSTLGLESSLRLVVHEAPTARVKLAPGSLPSPAPLGACFPPPAAGAGSTPTGPGPGQPRASTPGSGAADAGELYDPWSTKGAQLPKPPVPPPPATDPKSPGAAGAGGPPKDPGAGKKEPPGSKSGTPHKKEGQKGKGSKPDGKAKGKPDGKAKGKSDGKPKGSDHKSEEGY
jgi:hypothetical protein